MDVVKETKEKARELRPDRDGKSSRVKKLLVPLAASAASGATAYAARKAPAFLQEKVLPRLKKALEDGGTVAKAKHAVEEAASEVGERVGAIAPNQPQQGGRGDRPRRTISNEQREKQQRQRAQRRAERREALSR
jgi:hypothetical protein